MLSLRYFPRRVRAPRSLTGQAPGPDGKMARTGVVSKSDPGGAGLSRREQFFHPISCLEPGGGSKTPPGRGVVYVLYVKL